MSIGEPANTLGPRRRHPRFNLDTADAYLRYIDATKRRPELRPVRIADVVQLLQQGKKERPKT
jgi:hypothetical protein